MILQLDPRPPAGRPVPGAWRVDACAAPPLTRRRPPGLCPLPAPAVARSGLPPWLAFFWGGGEEGLPECFWRLGRRPRRPGGARAPRAGPAVPAPSTRRACAAGGARAPRAGHTGACRGSGAARNGCAAAWLADACLPARPADRRFCPRALPLGILRGAPASGLRSAGACLGAPRSDALRFPRLPPLLQCALGQLPGRRAAQASPARRDPPRSPRPPVTP